MDLKIFLQVVRSLLYLHTQYFLYATTITYDFTTIITMCIGVFVFGGIVLFLGCMEDIYICTVEDIYLCFMTANVFKAHSIRGVPFILDKYCVFIYIVL